MICSNAKWLICRRDTVNEDCVPSSIVDFCVGVTSKIWLRDTRAGGALRRLSEGVYIVTDWDKV